MMKLEHMLFLLALLAFTLAALWNVPWPTHREATYSRNIESIRAAQRECLDRIPPHSFYLAQTAGGYLIACEPL